MTATTKLLPPAVPPFLLDRRALENRLGEALSRRLTTVVAEAGFGKSTLLGAWTAGVHAVWYTLTPEDATLGSLARGLVASLRLRVPDLPSDISAAVEGSHGPDAQTDELLRAQAFAALVCDALQERLKRDLVLVLDDAHEIGVANASARLIDGLCRQAPPGFHLVFSSRSEPPFRIDRLRGQGQVLEIGAADLAFNADEVAELLSAWLDPNSVDSAIALHEATGGWPAAVRLAIEALRGVPVTERSRALEGLRSPGGRLFTYLAREVFEREPHEVRKLVRAVALVDRFTPELCEALGIRRARETLASLSRRGLFLEPQRGDAGWYALSSLARRFVLEYTPLKQDELRDLHRAAAAWFESGGYFEEALGSLEAIGDASGIRDLLVTHGSSLLRAGAIQSVIRAVELVPPDLRDVAIEQLAGAARQIVGDWEGALACFERAAAGAEELGPGIAWRMGLIYHHRGQLDDALDIYGRGRVDGSQPRDEALLLAWKASAYWLRADVDSCTESAEEALDIATRAADPQALAAAHTVLAMLAALRGDRAANDSHYLRALDHAERAGDLLQLVRIRTNRGSLRIEEGSYEEALAELEVALRLADLAGFTSFRALALTNRGEAQAWLGRLEEAIADLEAARALYQRIGSDMVSYPLQKLGDIYRERGDSALARAAYEEAIAKAEAANDLQGLVPSLAGLARVLAGEEPDEAQRLAERAVAFGPGMDYVTALLAKGLVALAHREREEAAKAAAEAAAIARVRRDRAGLAEALELQALSAADPTVETSRLEEAAAIWRDIRAPLGEARAELALARLTGEAGRARAERVERRLRALGARRLAAAAAALLAELDQKPRASVTIQSLGRFRVLRGSDPVPALDWQSKKARDLLKILVARRGRPTPREYLIEALWPEQDPAKTGNRLSVALSTVRMVLDPEKRFSPDHFVAADKSVIRLELANVLVDIEEFLSEATAALELRREGRRDEARERLATAEAMYAGDFLEDDAYEDWAISLREEARGAYVAVARALADDASAAGDHDSAVRYLLRILERDAYDEQAHLGLVSSLVAAGRHGEARRCFRAYSARMEEIGVESTPFPSPAPA